MNTGGVMTTMENKMNKPLDRDTVIKNAKRDGACFVVLVSNPSNTEEIMAINVLNNKLEYDSFGKLDVREIIDLSSV